MKAEHFDRSRGTGGLDLFALVVDQGAHARQFRAGNDDVADIERAALNQNRGDGATAPVELGFDDDALGVAVADWP